MKALVLQLQMDVTSLCHGVTACREEIAGLAQHLIERGTIESSFLVKLFRSRLEAPLVMTGRGTDEPIMTPLPTLLRPAGAAAAATAPVAAAAAAATAAAQSCVAAAAVAPVSGGCGQQAYEKRAAFGSPSPVLSPPPGLSYLEGGGDLESRSRRQEWAARAEPMAVQIVENTERDEEARERHRITGRRSAPSMSWYGDSKGDEPATASMASTGAVTNGSVGGCVPRGTRRVHIFLCGGSVRSGGAGIPPKSYDEERTTSSICPMPSELSTWCVETCERMDPLTGAWEAMPNMPRARAAAAAVAVEGTLFVCGGCLAPDGDPVRLVDQFSTKTSTWREGPPMLHARLGAAAGGVGGVVYVCGGCGESGEVQCSAERFWPARGFWEPLPALWEQRAAPAAGVLSGHLYICGGRGEDLSSLDSVECLGLGAGGSPCWERAPPMAWPRAAAASAVVGRRIFVCGGWDGTSALSSVEAFSADTVAWESAPPMSVKRVGATAAAAHGLICVFGGNASGQLLSAEILDGAAWSPMQPMSEPRALAVAVTVM